ncbi:MAG: TonB-dependent receptor [Planctomycetes bacterium]|nr:TonB-dependent receptor [Planctomycetota bacterium]
MKRNVVVLFFVFSSLVLIQAQEDKPEPPVPYKKESKVSSINKIKTDQKHSPFSEIIIDENEITNQRQDSVTEILRGASGVHVARTGVSRSNITSIFTRGTNSNHTLLLIDGFKISRDGNQFFEYDLLNTSNLQSIEISKGPASSIYGSDAIGGVINLTTKKGGDKNKLDAELAIGKFSTYKERLSSNGTWADTAYSFDLTQWQQLANEFPHNDFFNRQFSANIQRKIGNKADLKLVNRFIVNDSDIFTNGAGTKFQPTDTNAGRHDNLILTGLQLDYLLTERIQLVTKYSNLITNRENSDQPDSVDTLLFRDEIDFVRNNFEIGSYYNFSPEHRLYGGVELEDKKAELKTVFGTSVTELNKNRGNVGYFLQDELKLNDWYIVSGIRLDDNQEFNSKFTERIAASYFIKSIDAKVRSSVGTSILEPTLSQNFGSFGNKDLDPERGISTEIGFEEWFFSDEQFSASVDFFRNKINDLIVFQFTPTAQFINGGDILTQGIETNFRYKTGGLTTGIGYTFLTTRTLDVDAPSSPTLEETKPLLRRPRHEAHLNFDYMWNQWNCNVDLTYSGSRRDSTFLATRPSRETVDDFVKTDLAITHKVNKTLTLYSRVDNVFDVEYQDVLGFPSVGVTYLFGIISTLGE